MAYLFLTKEYKEKKAKYSRIVQPQYYTDNFNTADLAKKWLESNPLSPSETAEIEAWLKEELESRLRVFETS